MQVQEAQLGVLVAKARAVWHWFNHCCSRIPAGQTLLRINVDQTAICLFQGNVRGNIFLSSRHTMRQNIAHAVTRTFLTHVAFICDNKEIQTILPQVLIANERTLTLVELEQLRRTLPPNVKLLRQKSAWMNAANFTSCVRLFGATLAPHRRTVQPVLLLDALKQHYNPRSFAACASHRIWPVLVPAKTT